MQEPVCELADRELAKALRGQDGRSMVLLA